MEKLQVVKESSSELIANLVLNGDISKMSNEMKVEYYNKLCHSLNLNPVTKPFQIIAFQGKTILYATKDCTEQLRKINKVSIVELNQDLKEGLCISKCKVQDKDNRYDIATGVVNLSKKITDKNGATSIVKLSGDDLANAIMKSETKAKRRATLSICGLGILDESELDTMPAYTTSDITQVTTQPERNPFIEMENANDLETVKKLWSEFKHLQTDKLFVGLKEKRKSELTPLKEHPLNEPEIISVDDILPEGIGEVAEVETESFLKVAITELGKCKTVTGMNNKFREIRGLAAYMFLDDAGKNQITEFCKTKKAELNEKK